MRKENPTRLIDQVLRLAHDHPVFQRHLFAALQRTATVRVTMTEAQRNALWDLATDIETTYPGRSPGEGYPDDFASDIDRRGPMEMSRIRRFLTYLAKNTAALDQQLVSIAVKVFRPYLTVDPNKFQYE